jgi:Flavodoxin
MIYLKSKMPYVNPTARRALPGRTAKTRRKIIGRKAQSCHVVECTIYESDIAQNHIEVCAPFTRSFRMWPSLAYWKTERGTCATHKDRIKYDGLSTLIAYFTRSGNTRVVAEHLHRDLGADIFEIEPATPYPADYLENVEVARQEKESQALRPLKRVPFFWNDASNPSIRLPLRPAWLSVFASRNQLQPGACGGHL